MDLPIKMTSPWEATAPGWNHHRLDGDADAELAIVGAGITGLAAALRAAESGKSVIVLDAARPGWGASGRNGGQVIPGLKADPDEIVARFGAERGERLVEFAGQAADAVFLNIERHDTVTQPLAMRFCSQVISSWLNPGQKPSRQNRLLSDLNPASLSLLCRRESRRFTSALVSKAGESATPPVRPLLAKSRLSTQ